MYLTLNPYRTGEIIVHVLEIFLQKAIEKNLLFQV